MVTTVIRLYLFPHPLVREKETEVLILHYKIFFFTNPDDIAVNFACLAV